MSDWADEAKKAAWAWLDRTMPKYSNIGWDKRPLGKDDRYSFEKHAFEQLIVGLWRQARAEGRREGLERAAQWLEREDTAFDPDDLYTGRKIRVKAIRALAQQDDEKELNDAPAE